MSLYSFFGITEEELQNHRYNEKQIPKKIRDYVLQRDNYSCRSCNKSDFIEVHHVVPRSTSRNHHPENLVTLCYKCHGMIHTGYLTVVAVKETFFFGGKARWTRIK